MDGRLGDGQPGEHGLRAGPDRRGERGGLERCPDVGPAAVGRVRRQAGHGDVDGPQAGARHLVGGQPRGPREDRVDRGLEDLERGAGVDQRPHEHVPGHAEAGVHPAVATPDGGAHRGAAICAARWPAPYPLSMFTTATPGAQEFSIVSSAASPSNAAP